MTVTQVVTTTRDEQIVAAITAVMSARLHAEVDRILPDLVTDVVVVLLAPELIEVRPLALPHG